MAVLVNGQVGRRLEDDRHLGHAATQALAGAQVERHPGPAAVVDVQRHRGVRLGGRGLADALLLEEADDLLAALPARGVLPARGGQVEAAGQADRGEQLQLLDAQVLGVERRGLLHRHQRHQLHQVVLDHVAGGADTVVVAGPAADADVLGHRDLDVVDVVGVPDRLEHRVREAHRQDVLHRLLAEVVVDPEDRARREDLGQCGVQLARRLLVVPERLLHDDAAPRAGPGLREPVLLELSDDVAEEARAGSRGRRRGCRRCRAPRRAPRWCGAAC